MGAACIYLFVLYLTVKLTNFKTILIHLKTTTGSSFIHSSKLHVFMKISIFFPKTSRHSGIVSRCCRSLFKV